MPRKKKEKDPNEMTTEELARKLFPPAVIEEVKRIARENDERQEKKPKRKSS